MFLIMKLQSKYGWHMYNYIYDRGYSYVVRCCSIAKILTVLMFIKHNNKPDQSLSEMGLRYLTKTGQIWFGLN